MRCAAEGPDHELVGFPPTAPIPAVGSIARSPSLATGRSRLSGAAPMLRVLRCFPVAGSSNEHWLGSIETDAWQRTSRRRSPAPRLGSTWDLFSSSFGGSRPSPIALFWSFPLISRHQAQVGYGRTPNRFAFTSTASAEAATLLVARPRPRGDWIGGWLPARQSGWRRGLREGPRKDHTRSSACNATRPDLRLCVLCNLAVAPIGDPAQRIKTWGRSTNTGVARFATSNHR